MSTAYQVLCNFGLRCLHSLGLIVISIGIERLGYLELFKMCQNKKETVSALDY